VKFSVDFFKDFLLNGSNGRNEILHNLHWNCLSIKQVLNKSFLLNGHMITISCSIGSSIFPDEGEHEEILVKKADAARYKTKQAGENTYKAHRE